MARHTHTIMVLKQMKRFFLIVPAIVFAMGISAQESASSISADRPGMATGVDVMPFKSVQAHSFLDPV